MTFLIPGFENKSVCIETNDGPIDIAYQIGGSGPPMLLLHGFPQTKAIWHRTAPELAKHYTVIASDLRGYGQSSRPHGKPDHSTYSKRAMAADQHALMSALGYSQFFLVGHDRGGRVSHRLAMDFPESVLRLMVLDISPTLNMYESTTQQFATGYWHWFFLIQPEPIPEAMIGSNPEFWIQNHMGRYAGTGVFEKACWSEYVDQISDPKSVHAMCEDYRAAASIDLEHDRADRQMEKMLQMPVHVLWGEHGLVNACFSPIHDWQAVAKEVSGKSLPCGHYIPEELPNDLLSEIKAFFPLGLGG